MFISLAIVSIYAIVEYIVHGIKSKDRDETGLLICLIGSIIISLSLGLELFIAADKPSTVKASNYQIETVIDSNKTVNDTTYVITYERIW